MEPQEVDLVLQKMAASTGQDFHSIKDYYEQHNLMIPLKDRVLADKAMDIIYSSGLPSCPIGTSLNGSLNQAMR